MHFGGTISNGQRFQHKISDLYLLVLAPNADGWTIDVFTPGHPKDSLTVFTPPIKAGPFEEDIEARNFICCSSWLLRPERRVIFSLKVVDLEKRLAGYPAMGDIREIASDGTAKIWITDIALGNLTDPSRSYIKRMTFKIEVAYNPTPTLRLHRSVSL